MLEVNMVNERQILPVGIDRSSVAENELCGSNTGTPGMPSLGRIR